MVLNTNTKRESGRAAQLGNVAACRAVADIIRTTLGPRSMLKMLLDPMGGVLMTNDGNCILREVDVSHPAAKSMIELSRGQDEEVGDGTTSVIVLSGEMMIRAEPFLQRNMHPTQIVGGYNRAMQAALDKCEELTMTVDPSDPAQLRGMIQSCLGTKFSSRWGTLVCDMALEATSMVQRDIGGGQKEIDIKRYIKTEKIPGGEFEDCRVLKGVMFNKDVTHSKMRRRIENPRVLLLDCPLEYKKTESNAQVELTKEEDWNAILEQEEQYIQNLCAQIVAFTPDIVITEKGLSDLAQHYFLKAGITAFRRLRKTDNNRVARACGATIVSRPDEISEEDVGTGCGLFEVRKIGDEYFAHFEECADPKACTVLLRGGSRDVLNELERNLQDAMQVARNIVFDPRMLPGGGATEMALSVALAESAAEVDGVQQWPYRAVAQAFEVIPRTLAQNCGADVVRLMTQLRAKHATAGNSTIGVDGCKGTLADMKDLGIWDPFSVKVQTIKTSIEAACMLLRIDDIVSGLRKAQG